MQTTKPLKRFPTATTRCAVVRVTCFVARSRCLPRRPPRTPADGFARAYPSRLYNGVCRENSTVFSFVQCNVYTCIRKHISISVVPRRGRPFWEPLKTRPEITKLFAFYNNARGKYLNLCFLKGRNGVSMQKPTLQTYYNTCIPWYLV